jgi:hypothetical protein
VEQEEEKKMSGFIEHLQQEKAELQKEIHEVKKNNPEPKKLGAF